MNLKNAVIQTEFDSEKSTTYQFDGHQEILIRQWSIYYDIDYECPLCGASETMTFQSFEKAISFVAKIITAKEKGVIR